MNTHTLQLMAEADALRAQRDELAAALRGMLAASDHGGFSSRHESLARAALAKLDGAA